MAEEFQAEICGGNWWINPSRSVFSAGHDVAGYGWPMSHMMIDHNHHMMNDNKARSNNSSGETNNSVCESPNIAFQEVVQKPHQNPQTDLLIDSTLQIMGFGLSPSDLNQPNLVTGGRSETIYSILQEDIHHQISPSTGFIPASPASFGYDSAALLHSLFEGDNSQPQAQQLNSFCNNNNNNRSLSYPSSSPNYCNTNHVTSSSWVRDSIPAPKQPSGPTGGLHFSNDAPFWNASESPNFFPAPGFEPKPKCNNNSLTAATKTSMVLNDEVRQELGSLVAKKGGAGERDLPMLKRARIETPSPLPTFKVRKEKLGDRITALQQLVSPFGKTDTASVLHEAIEYIKFLHDQVLSTPYMKNGAHVHVHQQGSNKLKDYENPKQDLKSRGLCLVPISSTFPVTNETTADFWTPTFGGTFR